MTTEDFKRFDPGSFKELMQLGYSKECLQEIFLKLPCRHRQVDELLRLICPYEEYPSPALFLFGHTGTGKTLTVRTVFNALSVPHAFANCIESYSGRNIYHSILSQLCGKLGIQELKYHKADNMNDFLRNLKYITCQKEKEIIYIILDKAERLRQMESNLLPSFLQLAHLTRINCCVLFLTEITWEKFLVGTGLTTPIFIFFPEYDKSELLEVMAVDCPPNQKTSFYKAYCNLILHVFLTACRDVVELRHVAKVNFSKFCEPLEGKPGTPDQIRSLWRNIESTLRKSLSNVYIHSTTTPQSEKIDLKKVEEFGPSLTRAALELPFFSKYLLIAGYLASHNPAQSDRRFFCKQRQTKMSKRGKTSLKTKRANFRLSGPKAFPLDRLLAIFSSILDGQVAANANLMSQVTSLATLSFLQKVTSDDQLDVVKFKCTVTPDLIKSVAQSIDFDLGQYIYDCS